MNNKFDTVAGGYIYPFFHCCGCIVNSVILLFNVQRVFSAVVNIFIGGNFCDTVGGCKAPVKRLSSCGIFKIKIRVLNLRGFCQRNVINIHIHCVGSI